MKKKIMHLLSSNSFSGAENVVISLIKGLEDEFDFLYASQEGDIQEVLRHQKIPFIPVSARNPIELRRKIEVFQPDVIHAHDFKMSILSAVMGSSFKVISHIHQNPQWINDINLKSITYMCSCFRYEKIIAVSNEIFEEAIFKKYINRKLITINNVVDAQRIKKLSEQPTDEVFDIAFIGRLTHAKDPLRFIDIIYEIVKICPKVSVVMIGDGDLRKDCELRIEQLKLGQIITMKGFMTNPYSMLKQSKMLVMTSRWEGFGLVAVEGMVLGKPVVATPVGGLKLIVQNNNQCVSDSEFAQKIIRLLEDDAIYQSESSMCLLRSIEYTDMALWLEKMKVMYNDL